MTRPQVLAVLEALRRGELSAAEGLARLRGLPFEDLGFATVDHHRPLLSGAGEVIYASGKTADEVVAIAERIAAENEDVLVTRCSPELGARLAAALPGFVYHGRARLAVRRPAPRPPTLEGTVLIVSAGTADQPVADEAALCAEFFGCAVERLNDVGVSGLHRLLARRDRLWKAAVIIVVAGMEGALPSVVGGLVARPVIAVPTSVGYGVAAGGDAALAGMLTSCAAGVVVVNVDNGFGAAAAAARMLRPVP
ncbi:MAG TPA: nickel pincer cofactor biosynthesis protein LarB [Candidatus Limnocylindria bacterium]|nr:nickel pincer cofactor biosynthesis protein LarB [Candidatus Limnocylindria bacterium]